MSMKTMPSARIFLSVLLVAAATHGAAQNTLVSVKKGNREDKSWAVFTFTQKAVLVGVSQPDMGKMSLLLWGESGVLNGSVITLDQAYDRSIIIKQASPSIIRAEILNAASGTMSVLKKDGYLVVAFNDERLLDGSTLLYGEGAGVPGSMTGMTSSTEENKTTVLIPFEGAFDWIGYVRSAPGTASLFIRGAEVTDGRNDISFDQGAFRSISLTAMQGETSGIRAELTVAPNTTLQIARKVSEMIVQASSAQAGMETPVEVPELASTVEERPQPAAESVEPQAAQTAAPVRNDMLQISPARAESKAEEELIPWDKQVSFTFRNTPIKDALQLVASSNTLNMVITEGVKGSVTMDLKNVTLRQAMDKIINTQKCEYTVDGSIITVKPVETHYTGGRVTRVYRLKYADAVNVAKVVRKIATDDSLVDAFRPEFLDFDESGKNRMDFNPQIVQGIRRSSVLVVTDRPEKIQEIDQIIRDLDRPPAQIFIESKMVEMSPNYSSNLGIDWDESFDLAYSTLPGGSKTLDLLNSGGLSVNREWQTGLLTRNEYATLLNFLQEKTDAKLILNPKINAMDNEEAIISIGQTVPIAQIQRGMGGQQDMVTFTYREVSIRLNVTPHVLGNGEITMYINPVIEEITEWRSLYGSEAPVTDKRSVNSIITVKNGETIVIGGLIRNQRKKTTKKVWLLGDLPLFGRLFQYETEVEKQTDLMIFITPNIVQS